MSPGPIVPPPCSARAVPHGRWPAAFGPRFFVAALTGLVWLGGAWAEPALLWAMAAWDLLVLAAWRWDLARIPEGPRIEIRRVWTSPLCLGVQSRVRLEIRCDDEAPLAAVLTDDIPASLRGEPPVVLVEASRGEPASGEYVILPSERGDAPLGAVYLRCRSRLGFAERWGRADLEQTVRVYPDIAGSAQPLVHLVRSRRFELEKRLTRQRGAGREFESLREYRDGDPLIDVCWTASARRGRLVTKTYRRERSQAVWILLDCGRLLRARVAGSTKLDHAVDAAAGLARVALRSGDRVGILGYGRRTMHRAGSGRGDAHLREVLERLALLRAEPQEADHRRALRILFASQPQRALLVWLTDLPESVTAPDVVEAAVLAASRHLVLLAAIGDPDLARTAAAPPEDEAVMYRAAAAQEIVERRELLLRGLRARGVLAVEADPGRLGAALVNRYLEVKDLGRL